KPLKYHTQSLLSNNLSSDIFTRPTNIAKSFPTLNDGSFKPSASDHQPDCQCADFSTLRTTTDECVVSPSSTPFHMKANYYLLLFTIGLKAPLPEDPQIIETQSYQDQDAVHLRGGEACPGRFCFIIPCP